MTVKRIAATVASALVLCALAVPAANAATPAQVPVPVGHHVTASDSDVDIDLGGVCGLLDILHCDGGIHIDIGL